MISKLHKCPSCGSISYLVTGMKLLDGERYQKNLKCRKCESEWVDDLPLLSGSKTYVYIWDYVNKISIPLHRWVWEQYNNEKLGDYDIVHHVNRMKGDNRPQNLVNMDKSDHVFNFNRLQLTCKQCGHSWLPKAFQGKICPRCKSPYWDKERTHRRAK
jgi:hypothetical protein